MYADVLLDLPLQEAFSYKVPKEIQKRMAPGVGVWVPLQKRREVGFVARLRETVPVKRTRPLDGLLDPSVELPQDLLKLSEWLAKTTCCGWGEALHGMLPRPIKQGKTHIRSMGQADTPHNPTQKSKASSSDPKLVLQHQIYLVPERTRSIRWNIYIEAIAQTVQRGKGSILLLPEIATAQMAVQQLAQTYGSKQVALFHGGLADGKKLAVWKRLMEGEVKILVGTRSAIFAPMKHIGLIVLEDEHDTAYKQEETPRYQTREVALERARTHRASVLLGSATPSLEAYHLVENQSAKILDVKKSTEAARALVQIVDLRRLGNKQSHLFSPPLQMALEKILKQQQQAILIYNRKGYATLVRCRSCQHIEACPSCELSLTYNQSKRTLHCRHCTFSKPIPEICSLCQGTTVQFKGLGTQKVESELARRFPEARIERIDSDVAKNQGKLDSLMKRFHQRQIDVLVGTQMILKMAFQRAPELVAFLAADSTLQLPDFRAAERTFQLIEQAVNLGSLGGQQSLVLIQTRLPQHRAISEATRKNPENFYKLEVEQRAQMHLPPVHAMAKITLRAASELQCKQAADQLMGLLNRQKQPQAEILGPHPAILPQVRKFIRWELVVKTSTQEALLARLKPIVPHRRLGSAHIVIDPTPVSTW